MARWCGKEMTMRSTESPARALQQVSEQFAAIVSYAWVILAVDWLASVATSLNQLKVPPLSPVLMDAFRLDLS
jgi:hypothetical protein